MLNPEKAQRCLEAIAHNFLNGYHLIKCVAVLRYVVY